MPTQSQGIMTQDNVSVGISKDSLKNMDLELSMLILEVRDLAKSIEFFRRLGLAIPDPPQGRPIVIHRMPSGVSLLLTTSFASVYDVDFKRPESGYQQLIEFYVGDNAEVERKWVELTSAGYHGRLAPMKTAGPFAAMVDDPDGNVILLTSDESAAPSSPVG
jgi:predicted lactoylglutathione lyase